jgi:hypothetical protein
MKLSDFKFLSELKVYDNFILKPKESYAEVIVNANIPYKPGIYFIFSIDEFENDDILLYYGKAGVTINGNSAKLNFHQLPKRLIATTQIPVDYKKIYPNTKKDITRAKLFPWYVENKFTYGIKIYWFITDWPSQDPNVFENRIKETIKIKSPTWKKLI